MFEIVIVPQKWAGGQNLQIPRPVIGPIDFSSDRASLPAAWPFLGLVSGAVLLVKRGTTGRYLDALRGSEVAAVSIGIDPVGRGSTAFALSAGIAGLGGGLLAVLDGRLNLAQLQLHRACSGWCSWSPSGPGRSRRPSPPGSCSAVPRAHLRVDISALPDTLNPAQNPRPWPSPCSASAPSPTPSTPRASSRTRRAKSLAFANRRILRKTDPDADEPVEDRPDEAEEAPVAASTEAAS